MLGCRAPSRSASTRTLPHILKARHRLRRGRGLSRGGRQTGRRGHRRCHWHLAPLTVRIIITLAGSPIKLTGTPSGIYRRPPKIGEHSEEILAEAGISRGVEEQS